MHQVTEGLANQLALAVAQDPLDRGALVPDCPVTPDQGDDIRRILDQRAEMLLSLGKGRGVRLERPIQRKVVVQGQELPNHNQDDNDQKRPENDRIEVPWAGLLDGRHHRGCGHGKVGQQQTDPTGRTRRRREQCRCRGGPQGSDGDQQVAGRPTHIDDAPGAVLTGRGEVGKTAIGQQVGEQSAAEQVERQPRAPRGAGRQDNQHRPDHHVAGRIGESDQLCRKVAGARAVHGAEDRGPADDEQ